MKEFTNVCILVGCETKANTHVLDVEVSDLSRWLFGFEFLEVRRHRVPAQQQIDVVLHEALARDLAGALN